MKKGFITGINGFVGSHLAESLLEKGFQVFGLIRDSTSLENIKQIKDEIKIYKGDLTNFNQIYKIIEDSKPDYVFHLAAQTFVPTSLKLPNETFDVNINGSCNLFESIRRLGIDPVIQIAGSSEEYGLVYPKEVPIKETNPLRPLNPYAVSKIAMDYLGYQYFRSYGLKIIRTRAFNHEGPRRGETFVTSNFTKQIAEIEKGIKDPIIFVGNLSAKRDYTDVRDIVNAYYLSILKCQPGEVYNICSGKAWVIEDILNYLLSLSKVRNIKVKKDLKRMRPSDVPILLGDNSKFVKATGWEIKFDFYKTLEDTLNYWRNLI